MNARASVRRSIPALVLVAAVVAACEMPTPPRQASSATSGAAAARTAATGSVTGTAYAPAPDYVVEFEGAAEGLRANLAALGATAVHMSPEIGVATVTGLTAKTAALLQARPGIITVTRDLMVQWIPRKKPTVAEASLPSVLPKTSNPTGAAFYACQWNMPQIDAQGAWAGGYFGSPAHEVADLDTGVDPNHIDLVGRVDLAHSGSVLTEAGNGCPSADLTTAMDYNAHGTFVSSIITSNGIGVAGVAPDTRVVAVKVLNCTGGGTFGDFVTGIVYAAGLSDVSVINMSLGAMFPKSAFGAGRLVAVLNRAVNYAESRGKSVVSAAGNDGIDLQHARDYIFAPAESGHGVSVYATDIADRLASYSNHGTSATWVGAPGGDYPYSGAALPGCPVGLGFQGLVWGACTSALCGDEHGYVFGDGTSLASPTVAGVAALLQGEAGGTLTPSQIATRLAQTADDLGAPGVDNQYSHGRVNAARAVER